MHTFGLPCHRRDCNLPWAKIYNGVLSVRSRHDGHNHENAISLEVLLGLLKGSRYVRNVAEMQAALEQMNLPVVEPVLMDVRPQDALDNDSSTQ